MADSVGQIYSGNWFKTMHLRVSTKKQNGKTYRYAQLVESYRRDDGVPAHRVVANLGKLSDLQINNIRVALKASREGKTVAMADIAPREETETDNHAK